MTNEKHNNSRGQRGLTLKEVLKKMEIERSLITEDWFEYARLYPYHSVKELVLPIKKKWFDMILYKEKKEEYREIKPYYISRLRNSGFLDSNSEPRKDFFRVVTLRNGYHKDSPSLDVICSLDIKEGKPEWGAEPGKLYYTFSIHCTLEEMEKAEYELLLIRIEEEEEYDEIDRLLDEYISSSAEE